MPSQDLPQNLMPTSRKRCQPRGERRSTGVGLYPPTFVATTAQDDDDDDDDDGGAERVQYEQID